MTTFSLYLNDQGLETNKTINYVQSAQCTLQYKPFPASLNGHLDNTP